MPSPSPDQDLVPSVLDRIIDLKPRQPADPTGESPARLADLKRAVGRDLEWLLNCRRLPDPIPASFRHAADSLLTFGLPDFTHASLATGEERDRLRQAIERAVARFEPRLTAVSVTLVPAAENERSLRFRIDALLRVDPNPEPIVFDSTLRLPSKSFVVQGD